MVVPRGSLDPRATAAQTAAIRQRLGCRCNFWEGETRAREPSNDSVDTSLQTHDPVGRSRDKQHAVAVSSRHLVCVRRWEGHQQPGTSVTTVVVYRICEGCFQPENLRFQPLPAPRNLPRSSSLRR